MIEYRSIPADYKSTGVRKYDGNPYIEALPRLEKTKDEILDRIACYPPEFTNTDRKKGELVRIAELSRIGSLIYPFAEYRHAATNATINLREAYICRNPVHPSGQQRRTMIAALKDLNDEDALRALAFKSTALGQLIMAVSGSGKTTLGGAMLAPYCHVIEHTRYRGQPLRCRQVPVIPLSVMYDGSLLGLCMQFFQTVDRILGNTHYAREARALRTIPQMVLLLIRVATAIGLALIFVDDLQNLRAARGKLAEMVLNLFSQILEIAGVSMIYSATPALEPVIAQSLRNTRKLSSGGTSKFPVMKRDDVQWIDLATTLWRYQLVKHPGELTPTVLDAWHACSGGNPAFTSMSFALAQRQEIGDGETLSPVSFERVAETDLILLKPAIKALLSGKESALLKFDDLIPKSGLMELLDQLGWAREEDASAEADPREFPELQDTVVDSSKPASLPAKGRGRTVAKAKARSTAKSKAKGGTKKSVPRATKFALQKAPALPSVRPAI